MNFIPVSLSVFVALTLPAMTFATVTIPNSGTPGGALPTLPTAFTTKMPFTLGPLTPELTELPSMTGSTDLYFEVSKIEITGISSHTHIKKDVVDRLAEKLRAKYLNSEGKMSIDQLNLIAQELTRYFAQEGYFLTKVYLPPQDVTHEGVVQFQVREGFLEKVTISGKTIYTADQLEEPFKKYIGRPITASEIESGLLTLRDYPGIEVNSVFSPGNDPAGTVMNIQVTQSDRFNLLLSANSYGSDSTGRNQGTITADIYNLTHGADDLELSFLQKFDPRNSEYYSLEYTRNFFSLNTQVNLGYSYNRYTLGGSLEGLGLGGISQIYHLNFIQNFVRNRLVEFTGNIGLSHDMGYLQQNGSKLNQDKITYLEASLSSQFNVSSLNLVNIDKISYQHGFNDFLDSMGTAPDQGLYPARQGGSGQYAQGQFDLASLTLNFYQQPARYQLIELQLYGQYSPDLLTSFSQMTFGGQSTLPAYDTSEYLMDKGVTSHLEWKFPLPGLTDRLVPKTDYHFGDFLHIGLFTDYGNGWLNDPSADESGHVAIADYGVGLYLSFGSHLQFEAIAARHFPSSIAPQDDEKTRYWVGMNYVYTRF